MIGNIYINGLIGDCGDQKGVELIDVIKAVQAQPNVESYNVHIVNSEGGVVDTGFEIYNYLLSLPVPVDTIGSVLVASISTVIFMAGRNRTLKLNTDFMIHLPTFSYLEYADSLQLDQYSQELKVIEKNIIKLYGDGTGLNTEALMPLLKKETWLTPQEAIDLKFATAIQQEEEVKAVAKLKSNINKNKNINMSEDDKNWLEKLFSKTVAKSNGKKVVNYIALKKGSIVNVDVTDANGILITFPDVEDGYTPEIGDAATIDGAPAMGEYLMPDGSTYVFTDGVLSQINEATTNEATETDALNSRIAELEAQVLKKETENTTLSAEVVNIKKQIIAKFEVEKTTGKKEEKNEVSPAMAALDLLKNNKKK